MITAILRLPGANIILIIDTGRYILRHKSIPSSRPCRRRCENTSSHIPCARSHQPIPGSPLPH
jgi:hypothetical protein